MRKYESEYERKKKQDEDNSALLSVIVIFIVVCFVIIHMAVSFFHKETPDEKFEREKPALISEVKPNVTYKKDDKGVFIEGTIQNPTKTAFKDPSLNCRFLGSSGTTIEQYNQDIYVAVKANQIASFEKIYIAKDLNQQSISMKCSIRNIKAL